MTTDLPSGGGMNANLPAIDGYDSFELLGCGRMSLLWKARKISTGRPVVVKILSENFSRNPECVNRLKADIKLAAALKHNCIAQIYGTGETKNDNCFYIVSEYLPGYSLGDWLQRSGRLAESDALAVAHFVADALRAAWNKSKLAHGDIKPHNIRIDNEGTTKVTDLGLARALGMAAALDDQRQSFMAAVLPYMSPEMVTDQSAAPDCRSDIYSLGATLYHMLTGNKHPVEGDASSAPQPVNRGLTVGSARLISRMMSTLPGARYQKWEEVIADLILLERGEQQKPAGEAAAAGAAGTSAGKAAQPSAAKPARAGRPAGAGAREKVSRDASVPAALPNLKRPAATFNKMARRSLYIALAFHVSLLLVAGGVIVSRVYYNREATFVGQPPPMRPFEPRKLEHQVKVQKRQRSSSRPSMAPRLVATKGSSFALPEIKVESKSVKTSFSPKFTTVSGIGMGVGLGMGYGLGGFGQGVSAYNFFGIKGRADRVVILVDVSESMIEDIRDGEAGYLRVKDKIGKVIDELSEQALFNVIVFADAASACSTNLMIASTANKEMAKSWLAPFNSKGNIGLNSGNLEQSSLGLRAIGGTTRLDLALTGAFEQGADTILIISDGLPAVKKPLTEQQKTAWDAKIAQWEKENEPIIEARNKMISKMESRGKFTEAKVWMPGSAGSKRREGQAAVAATEGHWETRRQWTGGVALPALTPRPVPPENIQSWSLTDFIEHFTLLYKELYEKKGGKKPPVIHCIGYCIDEPGGDFLKGLAKKFKGNYRLVGGHIEKDDGKGGTSYPTTTIRKKTSKKKEIGITPDPKPQPGQMGTTKPKQVSSANAP